LPSFCWFLTRLLLRIFFWRAGRPPLSPAGVPFPQPLLHGRQQFFDFLFYGKRSRKKSTFLRLPPASSLFCICDDRQQFLTLLHRSVKETSPRGQTPAYDIHNAFSCCDPLSAGIATGPPIFIFLLPPPPIRVSSGAPSSVS